LALSPTKNSPSLTVTGCHPTNAADLRVYPPHETVSKLAVALPVDDIVKVEILCVQPDPVAATI
jgi:hypothetical protein